MGPAEADINFDIIKNDNDTFTVKYTPPGAGKYTIMVLFAEQVKLHYPESFSRRVTDTMWLSITAIIMASVFEFLLKKSVQQQIFPYLFSRKSPSVHSELRLILPMMLAK